MDGDQRVAYTQRILSGSVFTKYKTVLVEYKELVKGLDGYQWTLGQTKDVTMEKFWTWSNTDANNGSGCMYLELNRCIDIEK